jgi:hypothetical protein
MILFKKVGAITVLALALATPNAMAADTATPLNSLTAREQAVIDFQNSIAAYTATARAAHDKFRADLAAYQAAQAARQAAIRPLADARQAAVLAANTAFTTAIATVGAYQTTLGPSSDAFLAKFSPSGVLLWATYFGGVNNDLANDVAINQAQEIILVGTANSSAGLATVGAHQTIHGGNNDGFIAKFSPNGALQWATYLGWDGVDRLTGVCVNPNGDIHVLGNTNSGSVGNFPDVHSDTSSGFYDVFLAKFSSAGSLKWITMFGGDGNDFSNTLT